MIKVVGLGPGSVESLTLGAVNILKNSDEVYLRTEKHPTVNYLKKLGISFHTYDYMYKDKDKFEDVYKSIAEDLVQKDEKFKQIAYGVPGHPLVAEKSVQLLIELCRKRSLDIDIVPSVSFIDTIIERLNIDAGDGLKIIDAFNIKNQMLDKRTGIIITQVYDKLIASQVKLALMEYYGDDIEIYFIKSAGIKNSEIIRKIKLYELDRQSDIDYLTTVYIPKNLEITYDLKDLLDIMKKLRSDTGCPWDKGQNHDSLKKYLIEESYEVMEAVNEKDDANLVEELGDVLFQIIFHCQIGEEEGFFNIRDVINGICHKMINRHPHVFGSENIDNTEQVLTNWNIIKKEEQGLKTYTDELIHVAKTLPGLMRAVKVQKKAADVGFDWDKVESALDKVLEEYYEVKNVYKSEEKVKIVEEIGDLIFACVNVARFLDIDPEFALNYTIEKFIKRFAYIEKSAMAHGLDMMDMTLEEMDKLWEESKNK
ncbi:nucleoside triphosphate pyrophosphohydrolase [Clostridium sp. MT-14]|jgi:tetrapyrrole methylase family protein/MazG family protein|uniref:Nucleoside triphosphate pyrophosphohydrolase n=1 Tax=Clostridium aromativorans TaxID=2836848 RepID=A0ABS8N5V1_9CLOT|nr:MULTISPECIES: nucleoside triphosphate pyrophosphohydrolase [Clostridium]KAA8671190.1 nucleoside triphosphate pyrophosphohydrolase [Clostridium sp. HV4-5-A1G]MCC9294539.1 nucleoside triphosphate pyrophosphohydrolase [Clostridium aromativorans]CAB1254693.1 putative fusion methylase and nucleotide pyrophosphohydrolase [Clostridiaceae bacterium BL-3]